MKFDSTKWGIGLVIGAPMLFALGISRMHPTVAAVCMCITAVICFFVGMALLDD